MIPRPGDRDLSSAELQAYVHELAARPELWEELVAHDPAARRYEELLRDEHLAVWVISWMRTHDTGFHDHDMSAGAVAVVRGAVREDRLNLGGPPATRVVEAGGVFGFDAVDIHRVTHAGAEPSVTIHAYSPPLWRMGAYEVRPDGGLARHSISYAEELRPIAGPVALA